MFLCIKALIVKDISGSTPEEEDSSHGGVRFGRLARGSASLHSPHAEGRLCGPVRPPNRRLSGYRTGVRETPQSRPVLRPGAAVPLLVS